MPSSRVTTDALLKQAILVIQTGDDDLRRDSSADATLRFVGGQVVMTNINQGSLWDNGTTHSVMLIPSPAPRVSDITDVTISTHLGGGISGDNWNVDKVALVVSYPAGSTTTGPTPAPPIVHDWLIASGLPLIRFTGQRHDLMLPVCARDSMLPACTQDIGQSVSALNLTISTGNDDLRGGSSAGDNCDVTVQLTSGPPIVLKNVNQGQTWDGWTNHTISIPLPARGLRLGDVSAVLLHTGFGGGLSGDNWNVEQVILEATLAPPACPGCAVASSIASGCVSDRPNVVRIDGAHGTLSFQDRASGHVRLTCPVSSALSTPTSNSPRPLQFSMTYYNDHGFEGGVTHCSITADFLRSNLSNIEGGADMATMTTTGSAHVGRQTLATPVPALDFSTSYYWADIDLFRDSPSARCNPLLVGIYLQ